MAQVSQVRIEVVNEGHERDHFYFMVIIMVMGLLINL
jgi:hypothetical protein